MTEASDERRLLAARYLAGLMSPADAQRFEQSVAGDPALLDELALGEQLARASRLIDVERLGERPPWWHDRRVPIIAAIVILLLAAATAWSAIRAGIAEDRMAMLEARAEEGFLLPPSTTRSVRADASLGGVLAVGGRNAPERADLRIRMPGGDFRLFRVEITRDDGTMVLHADRLQRDSNDELTLALNSSLLPPGNYSLEVEGFTWRGETVSLKRFPLTVSR